MLTSDSNSFKNGGNSLEFSCLVLLWDQLFNGLFPEAVMNLFVVFSSHSPPLPASSSTFLCSYSSLCYMFCPPLKLFFLSFLTDWSVFSYSSEDSCPLQTFSVFPVLSASFPPLLLFVSCTEYLGVEVKMGRLHVRQSRHHTLVFVWACLGVYTTPIRAHIYCLAS